MSFGNEIVTSALNNTNIAGNALSAVGLNDATIINGITFQKPNLWEFYEEDAIYQKYT